MTSSKSSLKNSSAIFLYHFIYPLYPLLILILLFSFTKSVLSPLHNFANTFPNKFFFNTSCFFIFPKGNFPLIITLQNNNSFCIAQDGNIRIMCNNNNLAFILHFPYRFYNK